jgi:Flp pilus assembly protein TadG
MMSRLAKRAGTALLAFRRETEGVVAVEFAYVGLPCILLLAGIIVIGFMLFCSASLDYATQKAARQIMTGQVQSNGYSAAQFKSNVLCTYLPATFTCSNVAVNLVSFVKQPQVYTANNYYQFVNTSQTGLIIPSLSTTSNTFCAGIANSYEVLEVMYPMPIFLSMFAASPQVVNGQFVLMSTATFKNEPFTGGSSGC